MEEIDGISSSGLGTLMACQTSAINADGQIKLANVRQIVHKFFRITGLETYFDIYNSEQDALDDF
jgi:anti-anti-sigma factor